MHTIKIIIIIINAVVDVIVTHHNHLHFHVIVLYLHISVLMHSSAGLVTGPALLSLHINNLNSRKMTDQYIQEPIISLNHFYLNIHSITHAVWC
jgi:hypothetical protein